MRHALAAEKGPPDAATRSKHSNEEKIERPNFSMNEFTALS